MFIHLSRLNMIIDVFAVIMLFMMFMSMVFDKYRVSESRYLIAANITAIIYCCVDFLFQFVDGNASHISLNHILSYLGFFLDYAIVYLVSGYLFEVTSVPKKAKHILLNSYFALGIAWLIGFLFLVLDENIFIIRNGYYMRADNWAYAIAYPLIVLIVDCLFILFMKSERRIRFLFAMFCFVPTIGVLISYFAIGISSITVIIIVSALIFYIDIYVNKSRQLYENTLKLQEKQTESMISQIQPHFLYNCITSAVALCRIDPQKAAVMMTNFGKYLRGNLDTFKQKAPIPFKKELEHIEVYLELEKVRFEDKLNVSYDIKAEDFYLPALSVQPIVENAVKHGISASQQGGTVYISSYKKDNEYYIEIKDDGVGFDTNAAPDGGRTHIGLENVRSRIELLTGGTMTVDSQKGKGTTVLIVLPENDKTVNRNGEKTELRGKSI